mmetsp:Transcript_22734/g.40923  ORF Transcript_22734/g.40923 Transcript_22734/m.40923 type:complete len:200 (+) Transcript_22734:389-988(+)
MLWNPPILGAWVAVEQKGAPLGMGLPRPQEPGNGDVPNAGVRESLGLVLPLPAQRVDQGLGVGGLVEAEGHGRCDLWLRQIADQKHFLQHPLPVPGAHHLQGKFRRDVDVLEEAQLFGVLGLVEQLIACQEGGGEERARPVQGPEGWRPARCGRRCPQKPLQGLCDRLRVPNGVDLGLQRLLWVQSLVAKPQHSCQVFG